MLEWRHMKLPARNLAAIAVLLAWGGSLAWLGLRSEGQSEASLLKTEASLRLSPGDSWFAVRAGSTTIGVAGVTLDTFRLRYRLRTTITLNLPSDSALVRAIRTTDYDLGASLGMLRAESRDRYLGFPRRFRYSRRSSNWISQVLANGQVVSRGEGATPLAIADLMATYPLALNGSIEKGESPALATLSGWPAVVGNTAVAIGGNGDSTIVFADSSDTDGPDSGWVPVHFDSIAATRLRLDAAAGVVYLWADSRGTLVGLEYPLGVRWIRSNFDQARYDAERGSADYRWPVVKYFVGSVAATDTGSGERSYLVSRRDGSPIRSGALELIGRDGIRHELIGGSDALTVLARNQVDPSADSMSVVDDPLMQVDSPVIREFADSFANEDSLVDMGKLRTRFARIKVDTSGTAPIDALGTLRDGRGRPDGLARLLAAVLTINGVTARRVIGVAPLADTLYVHSWVEVWNDSLKRWTGLDPLTVAPAGTNLIRLALAGSSAPIDILPLVADVRFTQIVGGQLDDSGRQRQ